MINSKDSIVGGKILENSIITPDGTRLTSNYTNHMVKHLDENGLTYMVDGGDSYLRRIVHKTKHNFIKRLIIRLRERFTKYKYVDPLAYVDDSLFTLDPIEKLRERVKRGGRGKDGKQPLIYVTLKEMNDEWLEAIIRYERFNRPDNKFLNVYLREQIYREDNGIKVD